MKTLAELEAENPDGFKNPDVSDAEIAGILARSKIKSDAEDIPSRIQFESVDDEEEED